MNRSYMLCVPAAVILFLSFSQVIRAAENNAASGAKDDFNAGRMIIEHLIDSHEWHIMDVGKTHISLPLPVILLYEGSLDVFMSYKFHHGHSPYKGYKIEKEGKNKGKIVRVLPGTDITDETAGLPLDLSITKNVLAIFISILIMSLLFISLGKTYRRRGQVPPKGFQSLMEPVIVFIRNDIAKHSIGEKHYERFVPFLLTLFFFILINNLLGLVPVFPGGANITGNLTVTAVLAGFTFVFTIISGNRNYWNHIFNTPNVPWWLKIPLPLMPVVELLGVFTKPFVLMIRLFANITAGHIVILGFVSLIFILGRMNVAFGYGISVMSLAFLVFMGLIELLVAFIQAYVFTLLSALYFGMATAEDH